MSKIILTGVIFFLLILEGWAQSNDEFKRYGGIIPLISNKSDIEKQYGKGENNVNTLMVVYKSRDASILVTYVYGNCESKYPIWNVPEWTVEEVMYTPTKRVPKLKKLLGSGLKFKKEPQIHTPQIIEYYNEEYGFSFYYDSSIKEVRGIKVTPSAANTKKFACIPIENGWKGIKTLETNKSSVNKILGTPKIDKDNFFVYETSEEFIRVNYSSGACSKDYYGRGSYNIGQDYVIDYAVRFKNPIKISDFKFDKDKYEKSDDDLIDHSYYSSVEKGIVLHIKIIDGEEHVINIDFMPTKSQRETLKCKV